MRPICLSCVSTETLFAAASVSLFPATFVCMCVCVCVCVRARVCVLVLKGESEIQLHATRYTLHAHGLTGGHVT